MAQTAPASVLFQNVRVFDGRGAALSAPANVLVTGGRIAKISTATVALERGPGVTVIDGGGRTLMPGLIDSHVHVMLSEVYIRLLESVPLTLATARAARLMKGMIDRGFTSVRDTGGADWRAGRARGRARRGRP